MRTGIVAETVADLPAAAEAMAADGAPAKRRRRRGGRGRGAREGAENGNGAAVQTDTPKPSAAPRQADGQANPNRRPSRQVAANRPSATAPAPAASGGQEKVGFFRRIGRLFGGS